MSTEVAVIAVIVLVALLVLISSWLMLRRTKSSALAPPTQRPSEPSDQHAPQYSKLVLGDVEHPSAVIEPFESPVESRLKPLSVSKEQLGQLQTIFRHAPGLAKSAVTATSNTYILRFPPEVAEGIRNNSFKVMESAEGGLRGVAVDAQGRIVSHGTLVPASRVRLAG